MRILFSGAFNPAFEALPEYLVAALRRLGHQVTVFDHRAYLLPGRLRSWIPRLDRLDRERLNERFLGALTRVRPHLAIVNQGVVLTRRTIEAARSSGTRCVNWFSDYPAEFERGLEVASAYDAFYVASSYAALRHRAAGHGNAAWLPFGSDPEAHQPAAARSGERLAAPPDQVVFVGSHYPERQVLLRFLHGLPVGIWGPGWGRAASDPHVAPMIRGGSLRPAQWRALYADAKVVVNIHYGAFGPREVSGDLANTRVFEILACGAHQVVDRQVDVMRLFREGEHLTAFSSGEELRERVIETLRDGDRRREVAARGRAETLAAHTYLHRARALVEPRLSGLALPEQAEPASAVAG